MPEQRRRGRRPIARAGLALALLGLALAGVLGGVGSVGAAPAPQATGTATATVDSTTLAPGEVAVVHGAGWRPNREVRITLAPGGRQVKVTAAADGTMTGGIEIPPDARTGPYQVIVTGAGADNQYAYVPIDIAVVGPRPTAAPNGSSFGQGEAVVVTGDRWRPGSEVRITLANPRKQAKATAGGDGSLSGSLELPGDLRTGPYTIIVTGTGADGLYAYLTFDIDVSSPRPTARVDSTRLDRSTVTVSGDRWKPEREVRIVLVPSGEKVRTTAGADGRFTYAYELPAPLAGGSYQIIVTGTGADGLYAYLTIAMRQGGEGEGEIDTAITGPSDEPPFVRQRIEPAEIPAIETEPADDGTGGLPALLLWILLVLTVLTVLLLILSSRRDFRRRVRHLVRRVWRRPSPS